MSAADRDDRFERRFDRQVRFAPLGSAGQERLARARVALVGCGALGGSAAQILTRAGVGALVLIDRDVVEPSNLARQVLFEERHARAGTPKVEAAAETLARIGGPTTFELRAAHLGPENADELLGSADLMLDGSDNTAARYLINDWAVRAGRPWIYAGVVGSEGLVLPVLPGRGPCLRCVFPAPPPAGALATCDSAGVILPAVAAVAALQCGLALRLLAGEPDRPGSVLEPGLTRVDVWTGAVARLRAARDPDCPCCARGQYPFLDAPAREPVVLCGRNAVQVQARGAVDLDALAARLGPGLGARRERGCLRFAADGARFTVFADGRALVEGTSDPSRAARLYERLVEA